MRVTLLNTFHRNGGAAVAANRLHQAFLNNGLDSTLLTGAPRQQEPLQPAPGVISLADTRLGNTLAFGRFVAERLYFLPFEKNKQFGFNFHQPSSGRIWPTIQPSNGRMCCICTGLISAFYPCLAWKN